MSGRLELHIGFVRDDEAQAVDIAENLRRAESGWSLSEVTEVRDHLGGCDPHNVPGTLGWLVSRTFGIRETRALTASASRAFSLLANAPAARLEIEFVYGEADLADAIEPTFDEAPTLSIPELPNAVRILDTPAYEIHFVTTPFEGTAVAIEDLEGILMAGGIQVAQTIRYRSARMLREASSATKLISTAYYLDRTALLVAAESIRTDRALARALELAEISVSIQPEQLYACYRPLERTS